MKKYIKKLLISLRIINPKVSDTFDQTKYHQSVRLLYLLMKDSVLNSLPNLTETRLLNLSGLSGLPISQGVYMIDLLEKTKNINGSVCEMGVAQGCTSRLIADEIFDSKELWLFDSFQGLPDPTDEDKLIDDIFGLKEMKSYKGTMMSPRSLVEEKLSKSKLPKNNFHIIPGFFPESLSTQDILPTKCSFIFIDFDFYKPIKDALHFAKGVLEVGGYIMVHDYGFFSSGAKLAVDEFYNLNTDSFSISFPHSIAEGIAILKRIK